MNEMMPELSLACRRPGRPHGRRRNACPLRQTDRQTPMEKNFLFKFDDDDDYYHYERRRRKRIRKRQ